MEACRGAQAEQKSVWGRCEGWVNEGKGGEDGGARKRNGSSEEGGTPLPKGTNLVAAEALETRALDWRATPARRPPVTNHANVHCLSGQHDCRSTSRASERWLCWSLG